MVSDTSGLNTQSTIRFHLFQALGTQASCPQEACLLMVEVYHKYVCVLELVVREGLAESGHLSCTLNDGMGHSYT